MWSLLRTKKFNLYRTWWRNCCFKYEPQVEVKKDPTINRKCVNLVTSLLSDLVILLSSSLSIVYWNTSTCQPVPWSQWEERLDHRKLLEGRDSLQYLYVTYPALNHASFICHLTSICWVLSPCQGEHKDEWEREVSASWSFHLALGTRK